MPKKAKSRRFASKADEAAWWVANEEAAADEFEKALKEGYVGRCVLVVTGDSAVAKVRLGSRDVAEACKQARERGVGFHTHLKTLIHEALRAAKTARKTAAL
jgi:hypothetical protein